MRTATAITAMRGEKKSRAAPPSMRSIATLIIFRQPLWLIA
jgi:hypothetical protein